MSGKLPRITAAEAIRALERAGFSLARQIPKRSRLIHDAPWHIDLADVVAGDPLVGAMPQHPQSAKDQGEQQRV